MSDLSLSSPAFEDGGPIPEEYGYRERNVNPPLAIDGVPDTARSLVLIVDDPDAREPAGKIWDHWVVWNVAPDVGEIPENWSPPSEVGQGRNDYGESGYGGPNPPDREHTYRFLLYALDTTLSLDANATKDDVYDAAEGHVVAKANLEGTYAP
ncbi:MAG: YbhB/YbcL family Raf kinase inhibitor-like protein [Haloarculaceae archaeon]